MSSVEEPSPVDNGTIRNVKEKDDETNEFDTQEHGSDTEEESEGYEQDSVPTSDMHAATQRSGKGETACANGNGNGKLASAQDEHRAEEEDEEEDDDDDDDDEGDEEDDDDDEEYEPALKYDLLGGSTSTLLEKDSASTLAVSAKHLVSNSSQQLLLSYLRSAFRLWRPIAV